MIDFYVHFKGRWVFHALRPIMMRNKHTSPTVVQCSFSKII